MRVVPSIPEHAPRLREICIEQASERARTEETYGQFTLLMYCNAYLEHGVAYTLLDDNDEPQGYILAAESIDEWERDFELYRRQIESLGSEYASRVADEVAYYESVKAEYPAHLHIDISEHRTGNGGGRMLMETLLSRLRADGVPGVSFGVAARNKRAIGFYRHMGFKELVRFGDEDEGGITFCMKLR